MRQIADDIFKAPREEANLREKGKQRVERREYEDCTAWEGRSCGVPRQHHEPRRTRSSFQPPLIVCVVAHGGWQTKKINEGNNRTNESAHLPLLSQVRWNNASVHKDGGVEILIECEVVNRSMQTKSLLLTLTTVMFMASLVFGQTGDLGAYIAAEDAALGASPGEIHVATSGTISEGKVSLSVGHDLVCDNQVTISLNAGSYIYQDSHTSIKNCIISSTSTPIQGEVQSINTNYVTLDTVTFSGGGNLVYWSGVSDFTIDNNTVTSITGYNPITKSVQLGYYLVNCTRGKVNHLMSSGFVFPAGNDIPAVLGIYLSSQIEINDTAINHVDASYDVGGSAIQIGGSSQISINGGVITHNPNTDGITTESFGATMSRDITITNVDASYDGEIGQNTAAPLGLGDGIDIINSRHVVVSNCIIRGSGYLGNQQPAIWVFIDDDVVVENTDMSDGSMGGIDIAGSPNVRLFNNTIDRNQAAGVLDEWQAGTATNVGKAVTFVDGVSGSFGLAWSPGTAFVFEGSTYQIASVTDSSHLILSTAPPDHSSPANWAVNSTNQQILGGEINDNGQGRFGGQLQVGISWANATSGIISGVTSIDTGAGTQLYALELANDATASLYGDNFSGNVLGGNGILAPLQNISPDSLSFANQAITTTSLAQTVTFAAGAVNVQDLLVQTSGDFSETDNCSGGLSGFATCQIQVTFVPTATGTRNGTLTISNSAPNSPQIVSLTGTGVPHGLGLSIATGGSSSTTITAGTSSKYSLSIGGAGVSGTASLICSGAPRGFTCNVPATEAVSATQSELFTVNVMSTGGAMAAFRPTKLRYFPGLCALTLVGLVILWPLPTTKQPPRRYLASLPLLTIMLLCSCGGGKPDVRTYTLTVTATVGSTSEQLPLTLTVQ